MPVIKIKVFDHSGCFTVFILKSNSFEACQKQKTRGQTLLTVDDTEFLIHCGAIEFLIDQDSEKVIGILMPEKILNITHEPSRFTVRIPCVVSLIYRYHKL